MARRAWAGLWLLAMSRLAGAQSVAEPATSDEPAPSASPTAVVEPAPATPAVPRVAVESVLGTLELAGRVLLLGTVEEDERPWREGLEIRQARMEMNYRLQKILKVKVSLDLASTPSLVDAYLRLRLGRFLALRAGRFKPPFSAIELASILSLPFIDRGLLHDQLLHAMGYAGREVGLAFELEDLSPARVSLGLGFFRGGSASRLLARGFEDDAAARIEARPFDALAIAASGYLHTTTLLGGGTYTGAVGAIEVVGHLAPVRLWAEGLAGENLAYPIGVPFFLGARMILAARFALARNLWTEPFVFGEVFDPNVRTRDDVAVRIAGGAGLGLYENFRVQIEVERRIADRAAPTATQTAIRLQLGSWF